MVLASVQGVSWRGEISPASEHILECTASQVEEFGFGARGNGDPGEDSEQRVGLNQCFRKTAGSGEQKAACFSMTYLWAPSR